MQRGSPAVDRRWASRYRFIYSNIDLRRHLLRVDILEHESRSIATSRRRILPTLGGRDGADIAIKSSLDRMRIFGHSRPVTGRRRFPGLAGPRGRATDPFGAAGLISPAKPEISFRASPRAHGVSACK